MVAILHNIRSLHNVGSIFRTADAAGISKLYLCGITPSPLDRFNKIRPQLAKVSLGAEKTVVWEKCARIGDVIKRLKKEGVKIWAIEQDKRAISYWKGKITSPSPSSIALVVGNEVKGLPKTLLDKCDKILEIPMRGKKSSLNVAVAFGVVALCLTK